MLHTHSNVQKIKENHEFKKEKKSLIYKIINLSEKYKDINHRNINNYFYSLYFKSKLIFNQKKPSHNIFCYCRRRKKKLWFLEVWLCAYKKNSV